jgi:hypothetical protein
VLFSNDQVAAFVNRSFEPVWESVRPVPTLRLDFGNGNVVTRTLNGNIATYVCTPQGQVLDVLPGIYTTAAYLEQLNQFRLLANYVTRSDDAPVKRSSEQRLREYHEARATALKKDEPPPVFRNMADFRKSRIEGGLKAILVSKPGKAAPPTKKEPGPKFDNKKDDGDWAALVKDTEINETLRRQQIHEQLAKTGMAGPDRLTRWVYKEVLHADLDDPYLGLGKLLFDNYVFSAEEKR